MGNALRAMARGPVEPAIAGGFVRLGVADLIHAWHTCLGRPGGAGDFRAWLAAREMLARRGRLVAKDGRAPSYGLAELAKLCGVGGRRAGDAVRRLVREGLMIWADDGGAVDFPAIPVGQSDGEARTVDDSLPGRSGTLIIPRRTLRFLARGARPALMATALAALLRCLSRRKAGWGSRGRLKASWVAKVFGVDARGVKAARAELAALGWLTAEGDSCDQWSWNRWGRVYRIELNWMAPVAKCHPSPGVPARESPPLDLDPDPLPEGENPDPAPGGPPGARLRRPGEDEPPTTEPGAPPVSATPPPGRRSPEPRTNPLPRPTLRDIRPEDLRDTSRTLELHRQAVAAGWSTASEADRLRFVTAAAHAESIAATNPAGLFRAIVEGRRWGFLTQGDEERARARIRSHESARNGPPPRRRPGQPTATGQPATLAAILARLPLCPAVSRHDGPILHAVLSSATVLDQAGERHADLRLASRERRQ